MFFNKYPHRANFTFAEEYPEPGQSLKIGDRTFEAVAEHYANGIIRLKVQNRKLWRENLCLAPVDLPGLDRTTSLDVKVKGRNGKTLLAFVPGGGFGVSGESHMFQFAIGDDAKFYGMGEKFFGQIELSGLRTKFWTTDVWSDFHFSQWLEHVADPPYFSTPYVVANIGGEWIGFLLHNPYPTFIETPGTDESRVFVEWQRTAPNLILGSEGGEPNLYIIPGPTLAEVTRKLQRLVGTVPLPPLWSLGYHQSRWEYGGDKDLMELDSKFNEHKIPCDGLWLDLDWMDGFRIFKTDSKQFPKGAADTAAKLAKSGRRIVPIIDPGVKSERGYKVYDHGIASDVFCRNVEGKPYIGMVWPGETVFPDFSLSRVRKWWAKYAKEFRLEGYGACWVDMNDPSTGPVDPTGMRFDCGLLPHEAHHNQYALGMQMATFDGFLQAKRNERPFILSRSGFIGSSRYAAIWTGDNMSSYHYLKMSIPTTIGMSLSGCPFNGPDCVGFGGDASEELFLDWIKAGFLFPFMRNHSIKDSRRQEPWAFSKKALGIARHYIQLRYKLLPYLYNLFIDQEERGDPILRPLIYHFEDPEFANASHSFLVGPSILQAPKVHEGNARFKVQLPEGKWFDARTGSWRQGTVQVVPEARETPFFIANGSIIPMQRGVPTSSKKDMRNVEIHVFACPGTSGQSTYEYRCDDGISYGYRRGKRSSLAVTLKWSGRSVEVTTQQTANGFGRIRPRLVFHGISNAKVNGFAVELTSTRVRLSGRMLSAVRVA